MTEEKKDYLLNLHRHSIRLKGYVILWLEHFFDRGLVSTRMHIWL
jgi:hypothetical protein